MVNNHSEKARSLWHKFFVYEENFLAWLNLNTMPIESFEIDRKLAYTHLINERTKPPKGFRHICNLRNPDDTKELIMRIQELKESYLRPVLVEAEENEVDADELNKLLNKFPSRFPEFYSDVKQINLSITPAYSSKKIALGDEDELLLKSYSANDPMHFHSLAECAENERKILVNFGLNSTTLYKQEKTGVLKLLVKPDELIKLAKSDFLQLRRHTGDQFRARVFKNDGKVLPVRFGLMILDEVAPTYHALPQSKRSHALDNVGVEFELPISNCNFRAWIK